MGKGQRGPVFPAFVKMCHLSNFLRPSCLMGAQTLLPAFPDRIIRVSFIRSTIPDQTHLADPYCLPVSAQRFSFHWTSAIIPAVVYTRRWKDIMEPCRQ